MTAIIAAALAHHQVPTGPAFDLVLLCHVGSAVVGLAAVVASGVQGGRLLGAADGDRVPASLRAYFAPGVNWAGRVLFLVPVFGFALLGLSGGAFGLSQAWVMAGLALWAAAACWAEGALWPAERRLQGLLAQAGDDGGGVDMAALRHGARALRRHAAGVAVLLVVAVVVMFAQPG